MFYCDEERYTSLPAVAGGGAAEAEPRYADFAALELRQGGGVLHSEADFKNILSDLTFESGREVVFVDGSDGAKACLFAAFPR